MENTKSTNVGITKEDYVKSLLISNKTVGQDPRKDYIEGAKATLEVDGKEIELDDEIGDLIVSDEMGLA